jgi:ubiquinone/menaquinone biosynthesis C-methylase UbiE
VDQQQLTVKQFGARAASYLSSAVHSKGADLDRLTALVSGSRPESVLDVGCGAGHASYAAAAGQAQRVVAYDPSADMLSVVAVEAIATSRKWFMTKRGLKAPSVRVSGVLESAPYQRL